MLELVHDNIIGMVLKDVNSYETTGSMLRMFCVLREVVDVWRLSEAWRTWVGSLWEGLEQRALVWSKLKWTQTEGIVGIEVVLFVQ